MNSFFPNYFIHAANVLLLDSLWRSRHSVVALVRGGSRAHLDPVFRATADDTVGAAQLECRVCGDQSVPIMASLHGAS